MPQAPTVSPYLSSLQTYAQRVRSELALEEAPIISYLGLHLLLARYGNDLKLPQARADLEAILGAGLDELQATAHELLANPHPAIGAAAEAWANMPVNHMATEVKPVPDQATLDRWASDHTMGMIEKFPLAVKAEDVAILLATAIALKTGWRNPFYEEDGMLQSAGERCRVLGVVDTEAAGPVAVLVPHEAQNIDVVSLIAGPEVEPARVWAAMDEVLAQGSLTSLPFLPTLTDGHAWTVEEKFVSLMSDHVEETKEVRVPAWKVEAKHDLQAAPGLKPFLGDFEDLVCVQSAVGEYTDEGFSAAAVTAVMVLRGMAMPSVHKLVRHVTFSFDRPHAVAAVARGGAWDGLRLFDAWVKP